MISLRHIERFFQRSPLVKRVQIMLADRRAAAWRAANPGQPFSDYYVDDSRQRLAQGRPHPTLGTTGFNYDTGHRVDWDRATFAARGKDHWRVFRDGLGITPATRCVDYGCGSLRLGQHAMEFLNPGNYWGIDVTDQFINDGLKLIDPALIERATPHLSVISDEVVDQIAAWRPDVLFSNAVLQHVPTDELPNFFDRLARMMGPGCRAHIMFVERPNVTRVKAMSWAYPDAFLTEQVAAIDPALAATFATPGGDNREGMADYRRMLIVERPA